MSEQDENYYCTDRSFNRFNDAFFKYLLATEKHKEFLLDLINAVFDDRRPDCVHGTITDLTLEDRELTAEHAHDKQGRLDIRATTSEGQLIDIEVQTYPDDLGERSLYYFAKLFGTQSAKGKSYKELKPVVIINILSFDHFKSSHKYHSCFTLREDDEHALVLTDKISVHFIEANKCEHLSDKNKNRLIRWMSYLNNTEPNEIMEMAQEDEIFKKVLEAEKMFVKDRQAMLMYEAQERYEMEMATRFKSGKAEGIAEGIAEGEKRERLKAANTLLEDRLRIARELFDKGLSPDFIRNTTKLSDEQLSSLRKA